MLKHFKNEHVTSANYSEIEWLHDESIESRMRFVGQHWKFNRENI